MSEWDTEMWYGLDVYGNSLNISMDFKQRYDDIRLFYTNKAKNPKYIDPEMILQITSIGHSMKYTLPFTPEIQIHYMLGGNGRRLKGLTPITLPYVPHLGCFYLQMDLGYQQPPTIIVEGVGAKLISDSSVTTILSYR